MALKKRAVPADSSKDPSLVLHLLWLIAGLCTCYAGSARSFDAQTNAEHAPLKDVSHALLDQWGFGDTELHDPWYHDAYCHGLLVVSLLVGLTLSYQHPSIDGKGLLCEWCKIHGLLLCMKGSLMVVTTVPTPLFSCRNSGEVISSGQLEHFCNDLMFSGHSVLMVMLPFFLQQCSFLPVWVRMLWWLGGFGGLLIILATHQHYSSDVLVAVYLSTAMLLSRIGQIRHCWGVVE